MNKSKNESQITDKQVENEISDNNTYSIGYYLSNTKRNKLLFQFLHPIFQLSTQLYNQVIYYSKNWYFHNGYYPSNTNIGYMIRHTTEPYNYYIQLKSFMLDYTAESTVQMHYISIDSYITSIVDYYKHPEKYKAKPQFPKYLNSILILKGIATRRCKIVNVGTNNNYQYMIQLCSDKSAKKKQIIQYIPVPYKQYQYIESYLSNHTPVQIRILPISHSQIKIELIYKKESIQHVLNTNQYLGIDLGMKNFATCISTIPNMFPFILDGNPIIGINNHVTNQISHIQNKMAQYNIHEQSIYESKYGESVKSKHVQSIRKNRHMKIHSIFHQYSNYIIQYCLEHQIGTIIIGQNKDWKQKLKQKKGKDGNRKFGRKNTRQFTQIPYYQFEQMLQYKCHLHQIQYIKTEESYTSQVDHLGLEEMTYHPDCHEIGIKRNLILRDPITQKERKVRGLFYSPSTRITLNSDINGSIGILRKQIGDTFISTLDVSKITRPKRIQL